MENLFKRICKEEAEKLNAFWDRSQKRLKEISDVLPGIKESEILEEAKRREIYKDMHNVMKKDGYIGDCGDVIEYFQRRHLKFAAKNAYFEVQKELQRLYNSLPKSNNESVELEDESRGIREKMRNFEHINEVVLVNSILKAFQIIIPEDRGYQINPEEYFVPNSRCIFPWTHDVFDCFVDEHLTQYYAASISAYLATPMCDLKSHQRSDCFK